MVKAEKDRIESLKAEILRREPFEPARSHKQLFISGMKIRSILSMRERGQWIVSKNISSSFKIRKLHLFKIFRSGSLYYIIKDYIAGYPAKQDIRPMGIFI